MFDIGASELLVIVIVAVIVIGPKDLPVAMRTAGRWIAKMRKISGHFRSGLDAMVREAELEEMEKKWKEQNARIMREHPQGGPHEMQPTGAYPPPQPVNSATPGAAAVSAEAATPAPATPAPAPAATEQPDAPAKPADPA